MSLRIESNKWITVKGSGWINQTAYCVHDYRIKAGDRQSKKSISNLRAPPAVKAIKAEKKNTCIRSMITKQDTFPTTQTSNQKWNPSVPTIASSVYRYSLSETENTIFNAMVVTDGIIGSVTPQTLFQCYSLLLMAKPVALSIRCWTGLRAKSFYSKLVLFWCMSFRQQITNITHYCCGCHDISCGCLHWTIRAFEILSFSPSHFSS